MRTSALLAALASALAASQARAEELGAPVEIAQGVSLDPLLAGRLRYEAVDQAGAPADADALILRGRLGIEVKAGELSFLVEGEGTVALIDDYNDTLPGNGIEPFPVVADPENLELNRFQVAWRSGANGVTVGRQRIVLDNARFVGNVGWRQNEQTFDAVRAQARIGPVAIDGTYSFSQRTIFGVESPNEHFDGDFWLVSAGAKTPVGDVKAFAYLIDYDTRLAFSSQTYGVMAKGSIPLGAIKLEYLASFATQADHGANPVGYRAEYINAEVGAGVAGFALKAGYEELGSDGGVAAFQTPLATLHAFNGWADSFLTTPASGLRDYYAGLGKTLPFLPGLKAEVTYHRFDSDFGGLDYGHEWDASLGFKLGPVAWLAKYANYRADGFGVDTEKLWLQAEFGF